MCSLLLCLVHVYDDKWKDVDSVAMRSTHALLNLLCVSTKSISSLKEIKGSGNAEIIKVQKIAHSKAPCNSGRLAWV